MNSKIRNQLVDLLGVGSVLGLLVWAAILLFRPNKPKNFNIGTKVKIEGKATIISVEKDSIIVKTSKQSLKE